MVLLVLLALLVLLVLLVSTLEKLARFCLRVVLYHFCGSPYSQPDFLYDLL